MYIEPDIKSIGKRIKTARQEAKLSQYQLSQLVDISTTQLSAFENGKRSIGLQNLAKIASSLNKTIDEIYFGDLEEHSIFSSKNKGKLITNCLLALYEEGMIEICYERQLVRCAAIKEYIMTEYAAFSKHKEIISDFIVKLENLKKDSMNYTNPDEIKKQIVVCTINKINKVID